MGNVLTSQYDCKHLYQERDLHYQKRDSRHAVRCYRSAMRSAFRLFLVRRYVKQPSATSTESQSCPSCLTLIQTP